MIPVPSGPLGRDPQAVYQRLAAFDLGGEVFSEDLPLVAFDMPGSTDLSLLKDLLSHGEDEGWWHYEVGCGNDTWSIARAFRVETP